MASVPGSQQGPVRHEAASGAARRLPSRRALVIAGLWLAAAALVAGQGLWLYALVRSNLHAGARGGEILFPSERWRFWGVFAPLLVATVAVALQVRWFRGRWGSLVTFSLLMLPVAWLLGRAMAEVSQARPVASVEAPDGAFYVLVVEPLPTDTLYTLYDRAGPFGLYWRRAAELDYAEDRRFTGGERVAVSADGHWLLVGRGGLWTDCFRRAAERLEDCRIGPNPRAAALAFEADMQLRSTRIAALTGLRPW